MEIIKAERYTISQRLHHWVNVLLMISFFFTGFELFSDTFIVGTEYFTQIIHFILGACLGVWNLILYSILIFRYKNFKEIFPSPGDFRDLAIILLCKIKIYPESKYPKYGFYDVEKKEYVKKYHPGQKVLSLTNILALFVIGITGMVLVNSVFPDSSYVPDFVLAFLKLIVTPLGILGIEIQLVHFLCYLYFILTTIIHFFLAVIPQNRNLLIGMLLGKEEIQIGQKAEIKDNRSTLEG
jgi:cytochrome b subunit of formate dehydrogenase